MCQDVSACASDVLVIFKSCVGDVSGVSLWCVVIALCCVIIYCALQLRVALVCVIFLRFAFQGHPGPPNLFVFCNSTPGCPGLRSLFVFCNSGSRWSALSFCVLHHYPLTDPLGGGVKNVSYNNFFLIYAIYIVRFWYLGGGGKKCNKCWPRIFNNFYPPPSLFWKISCFLRGGGLKNVTGVWDVYVTNLPPPPPFAEKSFVFWGGGVKM